MKLCSLLVLLSFSVAPSFAMDYRALASNAVQAPSTLGDVSILHGDNHYFVLQDGTLHDVKPHNIDPFLRRLDKDKLSRFEKMGYVRITQNDAKEFILRSHARIHGGGPTTAVVAGVSVRAVGYGALIWGIIASHGELLLHTAEIVESIEVAANTATAYGLVLPTP